MTVTRVNSMPNPEPEVPITDPRWLASTQPDVEPEPKPDVHWRVMRGLNLFNACGATDGPGNASANLVTCPGCLDTIVPVKCLAIEDGPGPLQGRCGMKPEHDGPHDWDGTHGAYLTDNERIQALACNPPWEFTQREMEAFEGPWAHGFDDTPSGRLPVRTPGAALEEEREVLGTWTA